MSMVSHLHQLFSPETCPSYIHRWLGKEMISLSPPPRRTGRAGHLAPGSSNLRTPAGALMLWIW